MSKTFQNDVFRVQTANVKSIFTVMPLPQCSSVIETLLCVSKAFNITLSGCLLSSLTSSYSVAFSNPDGVKGLRNDSGILSFIGVEQTAVGVVK